MKKQKRKSIKTVIGLTGLACALSAFSFSSVAQDLELSPENNSPVEVYGQVLDMAKVTQPDDFYTWDVLRPRMIKVLPESVEKSLAADQLCDHLHMMHNLYSKDNELAIFKLAGALNQSGSPLVEEAKAVDDMYPSYYAVSSRLFDPSQGVEALFEALPDKKDEILMAQNMVLNELVVSYVHDAAVANCSVHAQQKGYSQIWAPIAAYEPSEDPGWKNVPWYQGE